MARNKIGICQWSLPVDGPWGCKLASELGLDGIQLDVGPYERGFPMGRKVVQDAWLELGRQYNIEFPSMATRVSDYYSMTDEPGQPEHEIVKTGVATAVKACKAMGIPMILIPNFEKSAMKTDRHLEIVVGVMQWACDLAADAGITIAAENTFSIEKTRAFISAVDRTNFGLYFDFQNYYLANDDYTPDILEGLYDHVVELHVKDGRNKDLSGALLGAGDASFEDSVKVLKDRGYDRWIVTENYYDMPPLCGPEDDPVALIQQDLATLRRHFA